MTIGTGSATGPATAAVPTSGLDLKAVLQRMVREGASDLHLKVGRPPSLRVHSELVALEMPSLRPEELRALAEQLLPAAQLREFAGITAVQWRERGHRGERHRPIVGAGSGFTVVKRPSNPLARMARRSKLMNP